MKYFEENKLSGSDLIELHSYLGKAYTAVGSNLFFHSDINHLESPKHRILLAKSAYNLIGICEAVAELVPEGGARDCPEGYTRSV